MFELSKLKGEGARSLACAAILGASAILWHRYIAAKNRPPKQYILQDMTPVYDSIVWELGNRFYAESGLDSWNSVPFRVTSNTYIAKVYVRLVTEFFQEACSQMSLDDSGVASESLTSDGAPSECYVLELGAGQGKFAFLFLSRLLELDNLTGNSDWRPKIFYVISDREESIIEGMEAQTHFQQLLHVGILDFAVFDAYTDTVMHLRHHNIDLTPGSLKMPVAIIANYFHDSLRTPCYRVAEDGTVEDCLMRVLTTNKEDADAEVPPMDALTRCEFEYSYRKPESPLTFDDPALNSVVETYQTHAKGSVFTLPVESIKVLNGVFQLVSSAPVLHITSDKAVVSLFDQRCQTAPNIKTYGGAVATLFNSHALNHYYKQKGALVLPPRRHDWLTVSAFIMNPPTDVPRTRIAYNDAAMDFGVSDYLDVIDDERQMGELYTRMRISGFDIESLQTLPPNFQTLLENNKLSDSEYTELVYCLARACSHFFPGDRHVVSHLPGFVKGICAYRDWTKITDPLLLVARAQICVVLDELKIAIALLVQAVENDPLNETQAHSLLGQVVPVYEAMEAAKTAGKAEAAMAAVSEGVEEEEE